MDFIRQVLPRPAAYSAHVIRPCRDGPLGRPLAPRPNACHIGSAAEQKGNSHSALPIPSPYTAPMSPEADLFTPLQRYWGYSSFRPLQQQIVQSLIAGHDTCVVMPTGGGKSLCYQLPALVLGRTAVVISPLIALMQDQAAQLAQMGIAAAVLNSSISGDEQSRIMRSGERRKFSPALSLPGAAAARRHHHLAATSPGLFFCH